MPIMHLYCTIYAFISCKTDKAYHLIKSKNKLLLYFLFISFELKHHCVIVYISLRRLRVINHLRTFASTKYDVNANN